MSAIPINSDITAKIVAEWRTGQYSQQDLSDRHNVSKGMVNKLCKGIKHDTEAIVTAGVFYNQELAKHDDRNVTAVTEVVEERTKHIEFFTTAAVKNVKESMDSVCKDQLDYMRRAETIIKGKETVLGKVPGTAIQINNNLNQSRSMTDDELLAIAEGSSGRATTQTQGTI